jgi:hypothetical protein
LWGKPETEHDVRLVAGGVPVARGRRRSRQIRQQQRTKSAYASVHLYGSVLSSSPNAA